MRNKNSIHAQSRLFREHQKANVPQPYSLDMFQDELLMYGSQIRGIDPDIFPNKHMIKSTNSALEGGNLFIAKNLAGETWYIIGEQALRFDAAIKYHKDIKYSRYRRDIVKLETDLSKLSDRYKKIFNSNNILILFNFTYHLNLSK
ncbi:hypothetical protein [Francisella adeliensis]|uniref:Uncharacterized protein n=1 Tax=Francisella adeliensis TaxID=2007306 RepID=A0A2Z4Y220_9GAMM|nr:hypothetical protein [Francisella adeliensis]AXA34565.1 hypothetical protein CDH04_09235 [Francisella adeliensis]MBK2096506.1 hypothetical protein [Francisella adeliensis]QIW12811.1 hypothetical protein FZC43_09250 [Francisella adeliensis]QIW14689.1 hypothetical protein FZC44_09245 [Francisella adeliensis]